VSCSRSALLQLPEHHSRPVRRRRRPAAHHAGGTPAGSDAPDAQYRRRS
jgi:hypothetical protein